ncbi:MAG: tetratricopeptide repeat protein [Myxococcales bacterium]
MLKCVTAAVLAGGAYFAYAHRVTVQDRVEEILAGPRGNDGLRSGGARDELAKDTPKGLFAAEKLLESALEVQARNAYALAALADVETQLAVAGVEDRAARAAELRTRAETRDIALPERFEAYALALLQDGKAPECETYVRGVLSRYPRSTGAPRLNDVLGRALRAQGKLREARDAFRKANATAREARFASDLAEMLLEEGSFSDAATGFDRALQFSPSHPRAQIGKARTLAALARDGRADRAQARALLDPLVGAPDSELTPALRARALAARAEARLVLGDVPGAAEDVKAALAIDPKLAVALKARAVAALSGKNHARAEDDLRAAIAADRFDISIYSDGADALISAGETDAAVRLLDAAATAVPRTARLAVARARVEERKGDLAAAQAAVDQALKLDPQNATAYLVAGRIAEARRDPKAAAQAYARAAQLRDDLAEPYLRMGSLYLASKQVTEAIRVFNEALVRYRATRAPPGVMEAFYADVQSSLGRAGERKLAAEWLKSARAER